MREDLKRLFLGNKLKHENLNKIISLFHYTYIIYTTSLYIHFIFLVDLIFK